MSAFELNDSEVDAVLRRARPGRSRADVDSLLQRSRAGGGLSADDVAALWYSPEVGTEELFECAVAMRAEHPVHIETFSPLYMTNTCDAECLMCGMRRNNDSLRRETADIDSVEQQLRLLIARGMYAVALLTGEYREERRPWAIAYVNRALRIAHELGFRHILVNVGSIDDQEFAALLDGIPRDFDGALEPKVTMCTFQETYSRRAYAKFMGIDADNPRADYERRLRNFDRAFDAGMRVANPGVLIGLNPDLGYELTALALHVRHLLERGMEVYVSTPRLRQIAGGGTRRGVGDEEFTRLVALLVLGLPAAKVVLTTRESAEIQHRLAPIINVISSGSSAGVPYTADGARFPLDSSQFEVIDQRPFEAVLAEFDARGPIENYSPQP